MVMGAERYWAREGWMEEDAKRRMELGWLLGWGNAREHLIGCGAVGLAKESEQRARN